MECLAGPFVCLVAVLNSNAALQMEGTGANALRLISYAAGKSSVFQCHEIGNQIRHFPGFDFLFKALGHQ